MASNSPNWGAFCLPLGNDWLLVELKENEFGSVPEKSFTIGGADFGRADVFAISLWVCYSGEFPFTTISVFVDQNHQIVPLEITPGARATSKYILSSRRSRRS